MVTYTWASRSEEDQGTEVCGAFVAEGTSSIDQSCNSICLKTRADDGGTPACGSSCGFLGLEEFFLAISCFGALVGIAEDWGKDGGGRDLGEENAEGDGRGLDGRKICSVFVSCCLEELELMT